MTKIAKLISTLPDSVKCNITTYKDVTLIKTDGTKKRATRVLMDRLLTNEEKTELSKNKSIIGVGSVAHYRYAPEIQYSYFYVI